MFHLHSERFYSPLNQAQTEEFNAFCKALAEYHLIDDYRFYYADPDPFRDREIPLEELIRDLQEKLNAINPSILKIIRRLEKTQPLKLQLQESLMVFAKVFFQLKWEKDWAMDYHNMVFSQEQKETLNKQHDEWMSKQITCYFSNVQTFANEYLFDIEGIQAFTRFMRDFFPTPEEHDQLFTMYRQGYAERFWKESRHKLQNSLYNLLCRAFMVENPPMTVLPLPLSVPQRPVPSARELMPPPSARPKRFPSQPVCVLASPAIVPLQPVSWGYNSKLQPSLEEEPRMPPQQIKRPRSDEDLTQPSVPHKRANAKASF